MSLAAVCIPVREDAPGLRKTLASLHDAGPDVRVVVAVDGPDATLEAIASQAGATTVVLPAPRGSYAARNAAVEAVPDGTAVVLFTDAGCVVTPGWVAAHRRALDDAPMSGGAVEVTLSERPTPAEFVDAVRNLRQEAYVTRDGFAATCNLAVRRTVLDGLRFDDTLISSGDREFCHRARAAGFSLVYAPDAVVIHPARRTAGEIMKKARRVAAGLAALSEESRPAKQPAARINRGLVRRARAAGVSRGWLWEMRLAWIDYRRSRVIRDTATRAGA